MTRPETLDDYIAPGIRREIEHDYYERINAKCSLAEVLNDPLFRRNPTNHVALFADHGVVHVRDVARQILQVLQAVNGVLIPARDVGRLAWMKGYGVLVAYIHDIGMVDLSVVGRAMHPEFAAQAVLGRGFDDIVEQVWADDRGGVLHRLLALSQRGVLGDCPPRRAFREMLAMALCHSKSKVPVALLNDLQGLRRTLRIATTTDLHELHLLQKNGEKEAKAVNARLNVHSADLEDDGAFAWLEADGELVQDVIDTLRALRCADALRQRGTVLKTSGNYEVFVDQRNASAIYALRPDDAHLYLLEVPDLISAGEANLASCELDYACDLRISFHHGKFGDRDAVRRAAQGAALVVNDIQADAIESFQRPGSRTNSQLRDHSEVRILVESADDNPAFANLVRKELQSMNPVAADRTSLVASLAASSSLERGRYLSGRALDWDLGRRHASLNRVAQSGHRTEAIDPIEAMREVRQIVVEAGETLIESGAPSGFVYIPLDEGLHGTPLGGYEAFAISPWIPLGVTGVIRGAARNSDVVADRDVRLLAIPKDVYLKHWHHTYAPEEFATLAAAEGHPVART